MILFYLNQAPDNKLRRIDLANCLGLTASGITRMLLPMEKIGLVKRDTIDSDARARYAILSSAGKRVLGDGLARINEKIEDILPVKETKNIEELTKILTLISKY
jgi:DNA-binding MarR family transcriptional regulator